jgi:hypothetical protein
VYTGWQRLTLPGVIFYLLYLRVIFGQVLFFAMIRLWPQNKNVKSLDNPAIINPEEVGPPGVRGFSKKKSGVRIIVHDSFAGAFAKDGAPNEAQRRRAFGGCGRWRLIPDTAEDRMTRVEGIGRGQKRGGSVVCEPRAIQSASGWVSMIFFFLKIPGHQVAPLPWDR